MEDTPSSPVIPPARVQVHHLHLYLQIKCKAPLRKPSAFLFQTFPHLSPIPLFPFVTVEPLHHVATMRVLETQTKHPHLHAAVSSNYHFSVPNEHNRGFHKTLLASAASITRPSNKVTQTLQLSKSTLSVIPLSHFPHCQFRGCKFGKSALP